MNEAIEDRVGERRIGDEGMPLIDGKSASDDCGAAVVAIIIDDFEQVALALVAEGREAEVVDHEELGVGDLARQRGAILQRVIAGELVDEPLQPVEAYRVVRPAGRMRAREEALAHAGG